MKVYVTKSIFYCWMDHSSFVIDNLHQSQYAMPAVVLSSVIKDTPCMIALPCSFTKSFWERYGPIL
jgi:hypothetical protein